MTDRTRVERTRSRTAFKESLHMWGQLYVDKLHGTIVGWLVDSWSEGAPYWRCQLHWLDKQNDKLNHARLEIGCAGGSIHLGDEDDNVEPERAKFIREMVEKWESEWLEETK